MSGLARWSLMLALAPWTVAGAGATELPFGGAMQGLGDVRHHVLSSEILARDFHVFVRLPEGYSDETEERFPTVYLLDAGITFPLLSGYYRYLSLAEEVPPAILVGIGYGTDDWQQGNMRGTDFTAPSSEREHYGGAARFAEVLRTEILPFVEERYRSDAMRRVVFGQSLGGQFALYAAQVTPGLFWGHIASNPALHRNLPFFLESRTAPDAGDPKPNRVFVSSAEHDDKRFRLPAREWMKHWSEQREKPWRLETRILDGENHFSAAPAAFRHGMLWLFADGGE